MQVVLPLFNGLRRSAGFGLRRERFERSLRERAILPVTSAREILVRCVRGCVWITDGKSGDVILKSGGSFVAATGSRVVVEAIEESLVEIRR